ncbi:MAG: MFS transporter [Alphaproteobacteria bacterium]|nr:MAG: MFS transporter [Alphaproteobacteria bacterium]
MKPEARAVASALVVTLGGFIFGLDAALISGGIGQISRQFGLGDMALGAVVSAPGFGVIFALLVTGAICDRIGRKRTLLSIAFLYLFSAISSVVAPTFELLVAARLIGGLAFTSLSVASIYIGEIAPPHMRGKLVSINQLNIVVGLFTAYFVNYGLVKVAALDAEWVRALRIDTETWRWMLGMEIVPALLWLLCLLRIHESPRWLYGTGRVAEARKVLEKVAPARVVAAELEDLGRSFAQTERRYSLRQVFQLLFGTHLRRAVFVGVLIATVQPLTGINAILFYAPMVFQQVGIGGNAAFAQSVIIGLVSIVFTVMALLLVDRVGRRWLTFTGLGWAAASLLICFWGFSNASYILEAADLANLPAAVDRARLAGLVGHAFPTDVAFKDALVAALGFAQARANESELIAAAISVDGGMILLGIMGFIAAYNLSIGPVMWVVLSELFPTAVRGVAVTACALVVSTLSYFIQQAFPWQLAHWGSAMIFLFYASCVLIGLVLLVWKLPETKNKSIEEIEAGFKEQASAHMRTSEEKHA